MDLPLRPPVVVNYHKRNKSQHLCRPSVRSRTPDRDPASLPASEESPTVMQGRDDYITNLIEAIADETEAKSQRD